VARPSATRPEALEAQSQRGELARYAADYRAAGAPLRVTLLCGVLAALGVYAFPVLVLDVCVALLRAAYLAVVPLSAAVVHLFRPGAGGGAGGGAAALPTASPALAVATPLPGVEGTLDAGPGGPGPEWLPVARVLFWPLAMAAIGAVVALVYRARRARRRADLERHPVDFNVLGEVVLFYVLTSAAGLAVGIDRFLAVGANAVFAWLGYVIWRWLYDRLLGWLAPAGLRASAAARAAAEAELRRRLRADEG